MLEIRSRRMKPCYKERFWLELTFSPMVAMKYQHSIGIGRITQLDGSCHSELLLRRQPQHHLWHQHVCFELPLKINPMPKRQLSRHLKIRVERRRTRTRIGHR
eukprot:Lithocolla_globosa_v1_NODE_4354_length_1455_cov_16.439286.p2 type:complete len:103 gc:universal NODE_4354_length_1455_cov_16.439286:1060-752(-)